MPALDILVNNLGIFEPKPFVEITDEDWQRFWSRVNALVGYDYGFLGNPPANQNRIGDQLSAMQWVGLLRDAGFESIDVLLRDAEKAVLASVKR